MPESGQLARDKPRFDPIKIRTAVVLRYENPDRGWGEIAGEIGVDVSTLYEWRHSEQWEVEWREIGAEALRALIPDIVKGYKKAFKMGRMAGVAELLKVVGVASSSDADGSTFTLTIPKQLDSPTTTSSPQARQPEPVASEGPPDPSTAGVPS